MCFSSALIIIIFHAFSQEPYKSQPKPQCAQIFTNEPKTLNGIGIDNANQREKERENEGNMHKMSRFMSRQNAYKYLIRSQLEMCNEDACTTLDTKSIKAAKWR